MPKVNCPLLSKSQDRVSGNIYYICQKETLNLVLLLFLLFGSTRRQSSASVITLLQLMFNVRLQRSFSCNVRPPWKPFSRSTAAPVVQEVILGGTTHQVCTDWRTVSCALDRVLQPSSVCQYYVTKWSPQLTQPTDQIVRIHRVFGTLVQQALVLSDTHASFAETLPLFSDVNTRPLYRSLDIFRTYAYKSVSSAFEVDLELEAFTS